MNKVSKSTKKTNKTTKSIKSINSKKEVTEKRYSVTSILLSKKYTDVEKDILKAILLSNVLYTHEEVKEILKKFNERVV